MRIKPNALIPRGNANNASRLVYDDTGGEVALDDAAASRDG
jgi:hypothetical protein